MNFSSAIQKVIDGGRITKLEWNNRDVYLFIHEGMLKIKKEDGVTCPLLVQEADLVGIDWVVVTE
jgi:hypothetical protein